MSDQQTSVAEVVDELQKTGIFTEILVGIELINAVYGLYKSCFPSAADVKAYLSGNYSDGEFSAGVMRPAIRRVRQAARKQRVELTDEQIEQVAKATLMKAMNADDNVVAACYSSQVE